MKIRINVNRTLKQLFLCALAILLIWTTGCAAFKSSEPTHESTESQAWKLIREGALLVDVRSPSEYSEGHLQGAVNIPSYQIADRISEFGEDKDRDIVLYCRTGMRAMAAELTLRDFGYTHIFNAYSYEEMLKAK